MKSNSQPGNVEGAEATGLRIFGSLGGFPNVCEERQIDA